MEKFYKAWDYLENCHYFEIDYGCSVENRFGGWCMDIEVVKVNPKTKSIDDDDSKNTKVQVWLETGAWDKESESWTLDLGLMCGGDTFEDAIIELARLVKKHYN